MQRSLINLNQGGLNAGFNYSNPIPVISQIYAKCRYLNERELDDDNSLMMFPRDYQLIHMIRSNLREVLIDEWYNNWWNDSMGIEVEQHGIPKITRCRSLVGINMMASDIWEFDFQHIPRKFQGILKMALHDPNSLSSCAMTNITRALCYKAAKNLPNAEWAAEICFSLIEKENGNTFLDSLLNSCREWYNERNKLLRSCLSNSISYSIVFPLGTATSVSRRWNSYLSFLTTIHLHLRRLCDRQRESMERMETAAENASSQALVPADHSVVLSMLIYDCCETILKPPSVYNIAEIKCLRNLLDVLGEQLQIDSVHRMREIVALMRHRWHDPSIPSQSRKILFELTQPQAYYWQSYWLNDRILCRACRCVA